MLRRGTGLRTPSDPKNVPYGLDTPSENDRPSEAQSNQYKEEAYHLAEDVGASATCVQYVVASDRMTSWNRFCRQEVLQGETESLTALSLLVPMFCHDVSHRLRIAAEKWEL